MEENPYLVWFKPNNKLGGVASLGLFRTDKRRTECAAVLRHAQDWFGRYLVEFGPEDAVVVVGDGREPFTATVFKFAFPNTRVLSVDPEAVGQAPNPLGVHIISARIQEAELPAMGRALVVMLHAHVSVDETFHAVSAACSHGIVGLVACPCCDYYAVQSALKGKPPACEVVDAHVLSRQAVFRIWQTV